MGFEYEEKEQYSPEDLKVILSDYKSQLDLEIGDKDKTITDLQEKVEKSKELETTNHKLKVTNLAISNGIDEDLFDLIYDEDIKKVQDKIDKLKGLKKEEDVDNAFKPKKQRSEDAYDKAISNKDVNSALKSKFGRLFG